MILSILLPSRSRPKTKSQLLTTCISKLQESFDDSNDVEIIVKIDDDDISHYELALKLQEEYKNVGFIASPRNAGYYSSGEFFNELAKYARGTFFSLMPDDCQFITRGWDKILYDYVGCDTSILAPRHPGEGNCLPIIHRNIYDIVGHIGLHSVDCFWYYVGECLRPKMEIDVPIYADGLSVDLEDQTLYATNPNLFSHEDISRAANVIQTFRNNKNNS